MGYVTITGIVAPLNPEQDTYPVIDPNYGLGGYRSVGTIQDRDAIPELRRQWGMLVFVLEDSKLYQLLDQGNNDLTDNSNWIEASINGSGTGNVVGYTLVFNQSNLSNGYLTVYHQLGLKDNIAHITIKDNTSRKFEPDDILYMDNNTVKIDLRSVEPIEGNWAILVTGLLDENAEDQQQQIIERFLNGNTVLNEFTL